MTHTVQIWYGGANGGADGAIWCNAAHGANN